MSKTGIYQVEEVNGWMACCSFAVTDCYDYLLIQRFTRGASNQIINIGKEYKLNELPKNWIKI